MSNDAAIKALLVSAAATNQKLDTLISLLSHSPAAQPAGYAQAMPQQAPSSTSATWRVVVPGRGTFVATSHRRGTGRKGETTWTNPTYEDGGKEKKFTLPSACRNMAVGQSHTTPNGQYVWTRLS